MVGRFESEEKKKRKINRREESKRKRTDEKKETRISEGREQEKRENENEGETHGESVIDKVKRKIRPRSTSLRSLLLISPSLIPLVAVSGGTQRQHT